MNGGHQSGAGQGRKPRPGLGFLPWLVTQKYYLSKPPLVTSSPTLSQASVGAAQSTAESPRLLWATEWAESLWLLLVSPLAGVQYLLMIEIRAGFKKTFPPKTGLQKGSFLQDPGYVEDIRDALLHAAWSAQDIPIIL